MSNHHLRNKALSLKAKGLLSQMLSLPEDWDYYLNRSGMVDMPQEWKTGIDTAQFGRHISQQEQGTFTQYGYIVRSGDEWQRVHEGQPVPEEYRIKYSPTSANVREKP